MRTRESFRDWEFLVQSDECWWWLTRDAKLLYPPCDTEDADCPYDLEAQYEAERLRYCNGHWKDKAMQVKLFMERHSRHLGGATPKAMLQPEWMKRQRGTLRTMQEILTTELTHSLPLRDLTN